MDKKWRLKLLTRYDEELMLETSASLFFKE